MNRFVKIALIAPFAVSVATSLAMIGTGHTAPRPGEASPDASDTVDRITTCQEALQHRVIGVQVPEITDADHLQYLAGRKDYNYTVEMIFTAPNKMGGVVQGRMVCTGLKDGNFKTKLSHS